MLNSSPLLLLLLLLVLLLLRLLLRLLLPLLLLLLLLLTVHSRAESSPPKEIIALHGTSPENIDLIASFGFDERLSREQGLYGQGIYFTDQSCKAFQYSGAPRQLAGCIIITRLLLGLPHFAQGPLKGIKVEPLQDFSDVSKGRVNSVIVNPGTLRSASQTQVHKEFVIFNGAQAYPEMIIHFKV